MKKGTKGKVEFVLHDALVSGEKFDLEQTVMVFTICERGRLDRKTLATAVIAWRNLQIQKNTAVMIHVGGYDEDPRELWQIPEVCTFVQKFCAKTKAHEHPALEPMSKGVLLACGADPYQLVSVNMITAVSRTLRTCSRSIFSSIRFTDRACGPSVQQCGSVPAGLLVRVCGDCPVRVTFLRRGPRGSLAAEPAAAARRCTPRSFGSTRKLTCAISAKRGRRRRESVGEM